MLNAKQPAYTAVPQELFGGLYTESDPSALPSGASPYCINCDFEIGSVFQRPGLRSEYAFSDNTVGPNPCTVGSTVVSGLAPWINPNNIALPDGNYATCNLGTGVLLATKNATTGVSVTSRLAAWSNPNGVNGSHPSATATTSVLTNFASALLAAQGFGFSISQTPTGIVVQVNASCATAGVMSVQLLRAGVPVGTPKTTSLTTTLTTYNFGNDGDLWGVEWSQSDLNTSLWGVGITVSSNINNATFTVGLVTASLFVNGSDQLIASVFNFTVPNIQIQGLLVGITGNQTGTGEVTAQLTNGAGTPVGNMLSGVLPGGTSTLQLGDHNTIGARR